MERKIRVLVAKPGLDGHDRGAKVVASAFRDAGMEVVYTGLHQTPEMIVEAAVQEDVDVVGVSTYCGGELALSSDLMEAAEAKGIKGQMVFLLGGMFPDKNIPLLKEMGFSGVFPPSSTKEEIVTGINEAVAAQGKAP